MTFKTISSKLALKLDQELMSSSSGFTLEQLMELAGFSVAQAINHEYGKDINKLKKVFIIAGPGNNGGDGLVCARHLKLFGFNPIVYYPKTSYNKNMFYKKLVNQLDFFQIPVYTSLLSHNELSKYLIQDETLCIVDSIFGFSFVPPVKSPFDEIMNELFKIQNKIPIVSIDIPTGWHVDEGPITSVHLIPSILVSLTVPKPCSLHIDPNKTVHYVGGRFIPKEFANKYGFEPFAYKSDSQVLKLSK